MKALPISPHAPVALLTTGRFHEKEGYFAYRPDGTHDWLLIYTIHGRGRFGYQTGELITEPGDLVLLRPGTLHDYGVETTLQQWDLLWSHFQARPAWLQWLDWPEIAPGLLRLQLAKSPDRERIVRRFEEAHTLATGAYRWREELARNALEEVLLRCAEINPKSQQAKVDPRVREAMEYACQHLADKLSLDHLADEAGLSVSRLAHLFRKQVGITPQQFIEAQRLARSCQLLEFTGKSIKEISGEVGFESPFYFTLRFKRAMGVSPKKWRGRKTA